MIKKPTQIAALASLIVVAVFVATTASTAQESHSVRAVEASDAASDGIFAEFSVLTLNALEYSVSFAERATPFGSHGVRIFRSVGGDSLSSESERCGGVFEHRRRVLVVGFRLTGAEPAGLDAFLSPLSTRM